MIHTGLDLGRKTETDLDIKLISKSFYIDRPWNFSPDEKFVSTHQDRTSYSKIILVAFPAHSFTLGNSAVLFS